MSEAGRSQRGLVGLALDPRKDISLASGQLKRIQPERVCVPLVPMAGESLQPCVVPGQRVLGNECIAIAAPGARSPYVHSPLSGVVQAIVPMPVVVSSRLESHLCVAIESDHEWAVVDHVTHIAQAENFPEVLRRAGITGLGGAQFPTATKLGAAGTGAILIANAVECEPYISCDAALIRAHAAELVAACAIILEQINGAACLIAVEADKTASLAAISTALGQEETGQIRLVSVPARYPAGSERQLIGWLLGRHFPATAFPSEHGVVCQNVATILAAARAAEAGIPLTERIVTVTGSGIVEPQNCIVPLGTPIDALVASCGGYVNGAHRLIAGGSMMGVALPTDAIPVSWSTNCLIVAGPGELRREVSESPCIRCGECAAACPAGLQPQELLRLIDEPQTLAELGIEACITCGCCDVVCPSHIELTRRFRTARRATADMREAGRRASLAQARVDQRTARLAAQEDCEQAEQRRLRHAVHARDVNAAVARARRRAAVQSASDPDSESP